MKDKIFWDSNLWIYVAVGSSNPQDAHKQGVLLGLLANRPQLISSAQVFNEVGNVLLKKYKYSEQDTADFLDTIAQFTTCIPLTKDLSFKALDLKARYKLSWFDSLIVAAALEAECNLLYTEDLHDGLVIEQTLTIKNPFTP